MTDTIDCSYCESCGRRYLTETTKENAVNLFLSFLFTSKRDDRHKFAEINFRKGWDSAMRALEGLRQE